MLPVLGLLVPVTYTFAPGKLANYTVNLKIDGDIPAFGGVQGVAVADLKIAVQGLSPDSDGNGQATYDLKDLQLTFNEAKFPMTVDNAKPYFPLTTISVTPQGKVLKTNAPDRKLPIRMPGLDVKRFPESTFLSVEWPAEGVEVGKKWSFKKPFGDTDLSAEITATKISDSEIALQMDVSQSFDSLEDSTRAIPSDPKNAVAKVHTDMVGKGVGVFDRKLGLLRSSQLELNATSKVTEIATSKTSERKLKNTVTVTLEASTEKPAMEPTQKPPTKVDQLRAMAQIYWKLALTRATPWFDTLRESIVAEIGQLQAQLAKSETELGR